MHTETWTFMWTCVLQSDELKLICSATTTKRDRPNCEAQGWHHHVVGLVLYCV